MFLRRPARPRSKGVLPARLALAAAFAAGFTVVAACTTGALPPPSGSEEARRALERRLPPSQGQRCFATVEGFHACFWPRELAQATLDGAAACALSGSIEVCCAGEGDPEGCWACTNMFGVMESAPVQVRGVRDAQEVVVGIDFACARSRDGQVRCWGAARRVSSQRCAKLPLLVRGVRGAEQLAAGEGFACALVAGEVLCWGDHQAFPPHEPYDILKVPLTARARAISASSNKLCILHDSGDISCVAPYLHELHLTPRPKHVPGTPPWHGMRAAPPAPMSAVSVGPAAVCGLLAGGRVACAGVPDSDKTGILEVPGASGVAGLSRGGPHACLLLADGTVRCLAPGRDQRIVPPEDLRNAVEIADGAFHACALVADGSVRCWGDNRKGQLGTGDPQAQPKPAPAALPGRAVHIAAGGENTCAVLDDGTVWCWGDDVYGQCGHPRPPDTKRPAKPPEP